ncbi:MAG: DUF1906 domain-containing protein [Verrucomicrobiota bacterium]|nr:DUF1906 domain-containing protein [Verrucomicrobiota bacterium]
MIDAVTPEGDGFMLNHDAHLACEAPDPPETITGVGGGGRHELGSIWNPGCGPRPETTFAATVTVAKPIAIGGTLYNPGDTFTPELNVPFIVDAKRGISTAWNTSAQVDCLATAEGQEFVIRYYVRTVSTELPEKRLGLQEAARISNTGMSIGVVFQQRARLPEDFSREYGIRDGEYAYNYALFDIGQPARTAIYFAVDFDATDAQIAGVITEYFEGVLQGFNNVSQNDPIYDIGVYSSGAVCNALLSSGHVRSTWLALATGWRGRNTFLQWNVKQSSGETACGLKSQELNISRGDFGQFQLQ